MLRLSLRQLEFFVATAETGTITAGAQRSGASQAAVSQAIHELEKRLGVQLLIRQQAKGVLVTPAGGRLLIEARSLLGQAEGLVESARTEGATAAGPLSVGCFTTLAPFFLPQLLDEFATEHPQIDLTVVDGNQDELREQLLTGQAEVAIVYNEGLGSNLDYAVIRSCRPYVILAEDHPLARKRKLRLRDLAEQPMITHSVPPNPRNSERVLRNAGFEPTVRHRSDNIEMVRCLVARGLGYGILVQTWPNDVSYEGRRLVSKQIADEIDEHRVVFAWAEGVKLTRRADLLVRYCVDHMARP